MKNFVWNFSRTVFSIPYIIPRFKKQSFFPKVHIDYILSRQFMATEGCIRKRIILKK